jgi:acetyl esterase
MTSFNLEQPARELTEAIDKAPPLSGVSLADARKAVEAAQSAPTLSDLEGLPPALVIVDENDLLRDQGEAYANRFRDAGVRTTSVRFNGTIHDFMRLNALRDSESTRAAISLAVAELRHALGTA